MVEGDQTGNLRPCFVDSSSSSLKLLPSLVMNDFLPESTVLASLDIALATLTSTSSGNAQDLSR